MAQSPGQFVLSELGSKLVSLAARGKSQRTRGPGSPQCLQVVAPTHQAPALC